MIERPSSLRRFGWLTVGSLAVATYLAFAIAALLPYSMTFSPPNNNWLSNLGDRGRQVDGARALASDGPPQYEGPVNGVLSAANRSGRERADGH